MRPVLALLAAAILAPGALAQMELVDATLIVFASDPGLAFLPGTVGEVPVTVNYAPDNGGRPAPAPTAERPEDTQPTRITLALKQAPSWVEGVSFDPPELYAQFNLTFQSPTSLQYSRTLVARLNISPEAPALQREDFVVIATAEPNGNIRGATAESAPLKLRATTVGELNVSAPSSVILPGGRWSTVEFAVRNDGNSKILAKINVTVRPENSQVEFLETIEIDRNATAIVPVRVRTPWTNAEFGALELEAVPIVEGEEGPAARFSVDVRGESAVPFPAMGALLVLASLAWARRRRVP